MSYLGPQSFDIEESRQNNRYQEIEWYDDDEEFTHYEYTCYVVKFDCMGGEAEFESCDPAMPEDMLEWLQDSPHWEIMCEEAVGSYESGIESEQADVDLYHEIGPHVRL